MSQADLFGIFIGYWPKRNGEYYEKLFVFFSYGSSIHLGFYCEGYVARL